MSKRDWIEVGVSMLGGAGIGAALMYLFDPEAGEHRREMARRRAAEYAASTGEALGTGWGHVSHGAQSLASKASDLASSVGSAAMEGAHAFSRGTKQLGSNVADYAGSARDQAMDWAHGAADTVRGYAGRSIRRERHSTMGLTTKAVGALALGAGLMFLLDPSQGRRRRALLRDKATSMATRSAHYARSTGRHIANKATGLAHEATSAVKGMVGAGDAAAVDDQTLAESARSAIGRLQNTSGVVCRCENGRVILTGSVPASGVETLVSTVRGLRGVSGVDNRLQIRDSVGSV
jgi:gas vesicle protein